MLEILAGNLYIPRRSFPFFLSFFFFVPREKRISTLEKMKLFHAKNLFLAIAREFFPLSLSPSSFFKYSKRFTSGETFRRFLRKIIRERLVATLSERRKILEKEKKRKKRNYSNFIRKGIVSISRGTLYWNITGGRTMV